jgi:hypothetical protein
VIALAPVQIPTHATCTLYRSRQDFFLKSYTDHLGRESRKERVIIARFRCGNEERENKYWNEDWIRVCRMCGEKNECVELTHRERDESREEKLNKDGRGIEWMKKVEWTRRTICGEG